MSEPGGGVIDVRIRKKGYRCQNQAEGLYMSEPGGGVIGLRTKRRSYIEQLVLILFRLRPVFDTSKPSSWF